MPRKQLHHACLAALATLLCVAPAAVAAPPDTAATTPVAKPRAHASISGGPLKKALNKRMNKAGGASGAWVYDATDRRLLYQRRAGAKRLLASNMKLFTTATALDTFGADGRLETAVWRVGPVTGPDGLPQDPATPALPGVGRRLTGDLYLVGAGDPAFSSDPFAARFTHGVETDVDDLADSVAERGITSVTGNLYADDSVFDRLRGVPRSNFKVSSYIGPLSGLSFNSGFAADSGGKYASDPAIVAAERLKDELRERGVRVSGDVSLKRLPPQGPEESKIAMVSSPPMSTLIRETNVFSNNFFAEQLLKAVGAKRGGSGTTGGGARVVRGFARSVGSAVASKDGSGLTPGNAASPKQVGTLIVGMLKRPDAGAYVDSLATAGKTGTLAKRMRGTAAAGRCRGKTGTINGVSTLSGVCTATGGDKVVFSFLMNRASVTAVRPLQDQMTAAVASYSG